MCLLEGTLLTVWVDFAVAILSGNWYWAGIHVVALIVSSDHKTKCGQKLAFSGFPEGVLRT